ncbi:MAG TPA: lysophospholipid acyltransferase family protein [Rhizomicrobium sp.]|jgi:1-acyl-sn-glycerol-3-phosphate acyltransferase|nr:lysophospholipid acyltransferase family protein [Rhizomicrobium sp.]
MILLRSVLFFAWFAVVSVACNLGFLWALAAPRRFTVLASKSWSRLTLWGLKQIAGLDYEVRGAVPEGAVLIASKHMSMWDTIALYLIVRDAKVVIKNELSWVPFYGWYAMKARMIFIHRDAGSAAMRDLARQGREAIAAGFPIIIFPEGTRKKPGAPPDYKPGVAGLYSLLNAPCVPAALNSGLFWTGPAGFLKKPGRIVLEFLQPIPPGLKRAEFMIALQKRIETATARLVAEGRGQLQPTRSDGELASSRKDKGPESGPFAS